MATMVSNGHVNGHYDLQTVMARFSDIPDAIDIPVHVGQEGDEAVEMNLRDLPEDSEELCTLLESERASKNIWMVIAQAYAKQKKVDLAIDLISSGLELMQKTNPKERIGLLCLLCWMYLFKSREAHRLVLEGQPGADTKTKEYFLQLATGALNDATRLNPTFPSLQLARGVLSLLRASLLPSAKLSGPGMTEQSARTDTLRQALKNFEDANRASQGRNLAAMFGKARALFSLSKYAESLVVYQDILAKCPELSDPDPRIGIGCCLWQLNHPEEAREAWERSLELMPESVIANILVGLYWFRESSKYEPSDAEFIKPYKLAMTQYTQKAFKIDKSHPLACVTFGGYFLPRQAFPTVDTLAKRAIELTDVNEIASDGWYLLARKEHYQTDGKDCAKIIELYNRADNARGGGERGFLPAKFGVAQMQILNNDITGAKFSLEKIVQYHNSTEAKAILGTMYAEECFAAQSSGSKEDKSSEFKKAVNYLDAVRLAWKDHKNTVLPDSNILLLLARLYEADHPEKSLACLLQAEQMSIDDLAEEYQYSNTRDEKQRRTQMRAHLPPELLNNIGCLQFHMDKIDEAAEFFQAALSACVKSQEEDKEDEHTAGEFISTVSFNLARTYEAAGLADEAKRVYEGLLERQPDYTDAQARLAYIDLRQNPNGAGPKTVAALFEQYPSDLEVRALYGWYLSRSKKRNVSFNEDPEQRHYKHTLQQFNKYDLYSLTGLGNLHLMVAREMKRESAQDKEKRQKTYERAAEFFDKVLQLDPKNAYAAQGVAIALVEDKKDFSAAVSMLTKVKDTVKDSNTLVNLAHVYGELKQYTRAIENYEAAIAKDKSKDHHVLACLARVWYSKAKHEKSLQAMKTSLEISRQALAVVPDQIHQVFNVAFIQIQLASMVSTLPETGRTAEDVETAITDLDEAIETFGEIAKSKAPPYPRHDIEQRANMGKNTIRKQLDRALQSQREYETANATRIAEAKAKRDAEHARRAELARKAEEDAAEKKRALVEERSKMLEEARRLAELRAEEDAAREEAEWTENTDGERVKRKKRKAAERSEKTSNGKRRKKGDFIDDKDDAGLFSEDENADFLSDSGKPEGDGAEREAAPRKRRKLTTKKGTAVKSGRDSEKKEKPGKYKSAEMIESSDDDDNDDFADTKADSDNDDVVPATDADGDVPMADVDADDETEAAAPSRRRGRVVDDDEDDE